MNNIFTQFQAMIPKSITVVVTITAVNGDGTSDGTTLSGVAIKVVGDSVPVGQKAFVKDGAIIRQAPNLSISNVVI